MGAPQTDITTVNIDKDTSNIRDLQGYFKIAQDVLLVAIPIVAILYLLNIHGRLGFTLWMNQYIGFFIALAIGSVFICTPPTKGASRKIIPWYDLVLALCAFVVGLYIAIFYPQVFRELGEIAIDRTVLGIIMLLITLEALRRLFGWVLVGLVSLFVFYGCFQNLVPGPLGGQGVNWQWLFSFLYLDSTSFMYLAGIAATIIIAFVLFGQIMYGFGAGKVLVGLALGLAGRFTAGPAKVAVIASGLFGTVSGSAISNVMVTGSVTIPMMKQIGMKPHVAGAIEAVSSAGGMIMPPVMGIVAFIMADILGVSYATVAIAAIIPASLYYLALFVQVHIEGIKAGISGLPPSQLPPLKPILKRLWLIVVPLGSLIFGLFVMGLYPPMAALYAAALSVIVAPLLAENRAQFWPRLLEILRETGRVTSTIATLLIGAGFIIAIIGITGLGFKLSLNLLLLAGDNSLLLLVLAAAASIVLGMGTDIIAAYILVAVLVAPALVKMGIDPIAAHLFVLYFGNMAMITPPVGVAFYAAAGIAQAKPMSTGFYAMRLALLAYIVPFLFVYNSALLLNGDPWYIAVEVATAILGTFALGIALGGYLYRKITWLLRIILFLGSAVLLLSIAIEFILLGLILKLVGGLIAISILLWLRRQVREHAVCCK